MKLPLRALTDAGMSVTEVCSLYMGRELLLALTGTPFEDGVNSLIKKIQKALSPKTREFLDALPSIVRVRPSPKKKLPANYDEIVGRLIEGCARRRATQLKYFSVKSNRVKDYTVHPYSVEYSDGGLYLKAFVPEYDELRWFALHRVKNCVVNDKSFEPIKSIKDSEFEPSLGLGNGRPQNVVLEFSARVAPYVRERVWHKSQRLRDLPNDGVRLTMKVCCDWTLHGWILSWGPHVHVAAPSSLAEEILGMLDDARQGYVPRLELEPAFSLPAPSRSLPLFENRRPSSRPS